MKSFFPSPHEIKQLYPVPLALQQQVAQNRHTIQQILKGEDPRRLLIVGPCSIHDITAAKEFATHLYGLSKQISSEIYIVMRTYFEKARSNISWKGFLYDPDLDGSYNIRKGIEQTRQLLLDLAELGLPTGAELLNPIAAPYYSDLLAWASIGARTCSSQIHREFASQLDLPVGFKNSTEGKILSAVSGVSVASRPQTILTNDERGNPTILRTEGNPLPHIVLRGGDQGTNYQEATISYALQLLRQNNLPPYLLIDCSHGNSAKTPTRQQMVFRHVLQQIRQGNTAIRGWMLESHLLHGQQSHSSKNLSYGLSITDPCLDWKRTKELICEAYEELSQDKLALTPSPYEIPARL